MKIIKQRTMIINLFSIKSRYKVLIMFVLIFLIVCGAFYCWYQRKIFRKWENLNIPGPEPQFLFGSVRKYVTFQSSITTVYTDVYKKYQDCRYAGIYLMNRPAILIRDPELVQEVLVKKFSHFHDNDINVKKENDPIFGDNPFVAKGDVWKATRTQHLLNLTGAKVKSMFYEMDEVGNKMVAFLQKEIDDDIQTFCMNALELMARYTTDVVTSCTLGVDGMSFTSRVPELRNAGKTIFEPNKLTGVKLLVLFVMPWLSNIFSVKLISTSLANTYRKMVRDVLNYRESNNILKNDFFDHTKEFRGRKVSMGSMAAQVGAVFIDGFGTNSSALNFMLYELAENVDVQNMLRNEIKQYLQECDGKITYEGIQRLEYLEAVIYESLRKYPPFPQLSKICTHEAILPKSTAASSELKTEIGLPVIIPIYAIQNDEAYFPDPKMFKPERFLPGNKERIVKYTYMPFGDGPRACIGQKFALLQSKIAVLKLVANFEMSINYEKTKMPVELDPFGLILAAKGRIWINFTKRQ